MSRASGHELVGLLHRDRQRLLDDDVLAGVKRGPRLLVVEKWRGGDVDELHVGHREQHLRAFHVRKTEPRGAGERRFAMRAGDAPQRGPRHLRELLRREHGEATKAEDADADLVRCRVGSCAARRCHSHRTVNLPTSHDRLEPRLEELTGDGICAGRQVGDEDAAVDIHDAEHSLGCHADPTGLLDPELGIGVDGGAQVGAPGLDAKR